MSTFTSDEKKEVTGARRRWWLEPKETIAKALTEYCTSLETALQRERYIGMVFAQLATGRAPTNYGMSMHGRIKGDLATALFVPPSENYIAIAMNVYANKIGKNRPFLQWSPLSKSDTKVRAGCRQATQYVDQIFDDVKAWPMVEQQFNDGLTYGTGMIYVDYSLPIGDVEGEVTLTRIQDDEVLLEPGAGDHPVNFQLRFFMARDTAIRKYGKSDGLKGEEKKRKERIAEVLKDTPGCKPGFYPLDVGYDDILALCIGFYIPEDGSTGCKVTAINGELLDFEDWEEELPIGKFIFEPIANEWKGQGLVEQCLQLQREVDRIADNLSEEERRFCWAKWLVNRTSDVDTDELEGPSTVFFNGEAPVPAEVPEPPKVLYEQLATKGQQVLTRAGISQNQAQGTIPDGVTAGIAVIATSQIDDVRHVAVAQRHEDGVAHLGKLIIAAAKKAKPKVYSSGEVLPWPEVIDDQRKAKARPFKLSALPQSIPGRRQALYDMLQQGEIDRSTYRRALELGEEKLVTDIITEGEEFILWQLDCIVEEEEPQAPLPIVDMAKAIEFAQGRLMRETRNKIKPELLEMLALYSAIAAQRQEQNPPPAPSPTPNQQQTPPTQGT
jgi:hypothetical protein